MSDTAYKCHGCQRVFLTRQSYELHICTYPINDRRSGTPVVPAPTAEPTGWRRGHGRRQLRSTVTYGIAGATRAVPTAVGQGDDAMTQLEVTLEGIIQHQRAALNKLAGMFTASRSIIETQQAERDSLALQLSAAQAALAEALAENTLKAELLQQVYANICHDPEWQYEPLLLEIDQALKGGE